MPVSKLLVEGDLDEELFGSFSNLMGGTLVEAVRESKLSLAPRTRSDRRKLKAPTTFYLRDRDFDHEPGDDADMPVVDAIDKENNGAILGWRWCRHEIENYLLEPSLIHAVTSIDPMESMDALKDAAMRIRAYQAARWTIGLSRSRLPRHYEFQTHPAEASGKDFFLPENLEEDFMWRWVEDAAGSFLHSSREALDELNLTQFFHDKINLFSDTFLSSFNNVLLWMSGKDLMQAMESWLASRGVAKPVFLRSKIRDWIQRNPEETLTLLPEWNHLIDRIRSQS